MNSSGIGQSPSETNSRSFPLRCSASIAARTCDKGFTKSVPPPRKYEATSSNFSSRVDASSEGRIDTTRRGSAASPNKTTSTGRSSAKARCARASADALAHTSFSPAMLPELSMQRYTARGSSSRRQSPGHVPALDEVDDLLACAHRGKGSFSKSQTAVAAKEARDHAQARVSDNVPHQAQFQFRRQTRFLSGPGRPCRDEFGDGLQILACVF